MKEVKPDINYLTIFLKNLREPDLLEVKALNNPTFERDFFNVCLSDKYDSYFLSDDFNNPLALGGAYPCDDNKYAKVWLLCTKKAEEHKKALFKYVLNKIEFFKSKYDCLYNFIYKSNFESLKWLKKCGFVEVELINPQYKLFYFINGGKEIDLRYITCK